MLSEDTLSRIRYFWSLFGLITSFFSVALVSGPRPGWVEEVIFLLGCVLVLPIGVAMINVAIAGFREPSHFFVERLFEQAPHTDSGHGLAYRDPCFCDAETRRVDRGTRMGIRLFRGFCAALSLRESTPAYVRLARIAGSLYAVSVFVATLCVCIAWLARAAARLLLRGFVARPDGCAPADFFRGG